MGILQLATERAVLDTVAVVAQAQQRLAERLDTEAPLAAARHEEYTRSQLALSQQLTELASTVGALASAVGLTTGRRHERLVPEAGAATTTRSVQRARTSSIKSMLRALPGGRGSAGRGSLSWKDIVQPQRASSQPQSQLGASIEQHASAP